MPIYVYRCHQCEAEFERIQPISSADDPACPHCDSREVERCLSLFASLSRSDGETRALAGASGCTSCSATSCASCKGSNP